MDVGEYIVKMDDTAKIVVYGQQLVRCKDCKKHGDIACPMVSDYVFETADNWYCADGERKD